MTDYHDQQRPGDIQRDIQRTRSQLGDTLDEIRSGLSPGTLLDRTLDYMKQSGPRQFVSNLGDTATENPVPVSLIGIGIAWLMMAGSRHTSTVSSGPNGRGARRRVGEAVSSAGEKAGHAVHGAQARAGEARERIGDMAYGAQQRLGQAAGQVQHQAAQAKHTFNYLLSEQPLVLGLLGVALGAVLGAGLPPTRQEDEMMGEVRDTYVRKAHEVGAEQAEKAKQAATAPPSSPHG